MTDVDIRVRVMKYEDLDDIIGIDTRSWAGPGLITGP